MKNPLNTLGQWLVRVTTEKNISFTLNADDISNNSIKEYDEMYLLLTQAGQWRLSENKDLERGVFDLLWRYVVDYREGIKTGRDFVRGEEEILHPPTTTNGLFYYNAQLCKYFECVNHEWIETEKCVAINPLNKPVEIPVDPIKDRGIEAYSLKDGKYYYI